MILTLLRSYQCSQKYDDLIISKKVQNVNKTAKKDVVYVVILLGIL